MVREDGKRNFELVYGVDSNDGGVFSGGKPRQAALKAARRMEPRESREAAENDSTEIALREKGTDKIHVYEAWAWETEAPENSPDWMPDVVTKANVSKLEVKEKTE